jgi:hypothetical protein
MKDKFKKIVVFLFSHWVGVLFWIALITFSISPDLYRKAWDFVTNFIHETFVNSEQARKEAKEIKKDLTK